jgi:hypothetical protein
MRSSPFWDVTQPRLVVGYRRFGTPNRSHIPLSTTNKMQRYTIFFIIVTALNVSDGSSAHHQELKNCIHTAWHVPAGVYTVLELLMMGGGTA